MNYNPYSAPVANAPQPAPIAPGTAGQPQYWEIGEVLGAAWEAYKANWAATTFAPFVAGIITDLPIALPLTLLFTGAVEPNSPEYFGATLAAYVPILLISAFFYGGQLRIFIGAARGGRPSFAELFSGGSTFLRVLGAAVLVSLVCFGAMLLLVLPFIYVSTRLAFTMFYVVDAGLGPIEAMKASWDATRNQFWKLFGFFIVATIVGCLGYLACFFGLFVTLAVMFLAFAIVYLRVSGRGAPPPPPPGYGYAPMPQQPPPVGYAR